MEDYHDLPVFCCSNQVTVDYDLIILSFVVCDATLMNHFLRFYASIARQESFLDVTYLPTFKTFARIEIRRSGR